jgi:succinate dehydrogenase / fumarate reductase cytochrome b subunit
VVCSAPRDGLIHEPNARVTESTTMSEAVAQPVPTQGVLFPRLGSVLAIAPLGVWVTWHLWENLYAWRGDGAWSERVVNTAVTAEGRAYTGNPVSSALVSLVVFAPLLIHTVWGLRRLAMAKPNGYQFFGNAKYVLQRLSALGLLGFLGAHVYLARISPALHSATGHESFEDLAAHMRHHPPTLVVYILGVVGTTFHLANGLYTASFIHGLAASPRAQQRMQVFSILFFVVLTAIGLGAVAGLFEAGAAFVPPVD